MWTMAVHDKRWWQEETRLWRAVAKERGVLIDRMHTENAELSKENTVLRKLIYKFADYVSQDRCEGCVDKTKCNEGLMDECWQMTAIREIASRYGIEVS